MTRHGKAPAVPSVEEGSSNTRVSESLVTGTTQQSGESQDASVDNSFAGQAVGQIEAVIELFRTKGVTKSQAIFKIGQIIAEKSIGDDQSKSDSLERYASTLDGIEALSAKSDEHGQRFTNPILGKRKDDAGGRRQGHEESVGNNSGITHSVNVDDFLGGFANGGTNHGGDDNSSDGSSSDESSDDDQDGQGRSNKKQRIYESQMPWFSKER
jgi:hypothetical protein